MRSRASDVEYVRVTEMPRTGISYAGGAVAGQWLFATGVNASAARSGIPSEVQIGHPFDIPKAKREAVQLFENLRAVLQDGGSSFDDVVRIDQYYTRPSVVDPYHDVRRKVFAGRIPPSTSNLHQRFIFQGQEIEVQVIAVRAGRDVEREPLTIPDYKVHPSSGYSHAMKVGDFVFVAGQTAEARRLDEGPMDPEARMPTGHLWKGTPIKLETNFILNRKLRPSLQAAGADLDSVVKCQVYLRDIGDASGFFESWDEHFPNGRPATTVIPTSNPGFIVEDERIEINTIALRKNGLTTKSLFRPKAFVPFDPRTPGAVKAGDLLLFSGLMAASGNAAVAGAFVDPRMPYFGSTAGAQMEYMLDAAEEVCRAAGTSLRNAVRIQQFHTDLTEFQEACNVWARRLPGQPLPISAVEVEALPIPGCSVLLDLWVYAPGD